MKWRELQGRPNVGVGRGGANKLGKDSPNYKTGIGFFIKERTRLKDFLNKCQRCQKDLTSATKYEWCLHHIDYNRNNNNPDNFEFLCKRCHQVEHDCSSAFNKVQRLSERSKTQVGLKRVTLTSEVMI